MKKTLLTLISTVLLLGLSPGWAPAATVTWTGALDSDFGNAANWSPGLPGIGDALVFPDGANWTLVDLSTVTPNNGPLTFQSTNDYVFNPDSVTFTLSGGIIQNGSGTVTFNNLFALGGASRTLAGVGTGEVSFWGAITDPGGGNNLVVNSGNYVLGAKDNSFNQLIVNTGAVVTLRGNVGMNVAGLSSYLGLDQVVKVDGGILKDSRNDNFNLDPPTEAAGGWGGAARALYFGPGGGTLMYVDYPPVGANSLVGGSADWFGGPRYYVNDATNGIPGKIILGQPGSFFVGNNHRYCLTLREGVIGNGDIEVVITNGAYMGLMATNMTGKLRIFGVPGGDSSNLSNNYGGVILGNIPDVDVNGYRRAFFNPSGIFVHGAVFFWQRHSERTYLATDITLEPGAAADFCGGDTGNNRWMNLGFPTNDTGVYQMTNTITIKSGARANMNLQLRPDMRSRGIRIWSKIDIQAGGTLKFYRSFDTGTSYVIETFWPITGMGSASGESRVVVDLPYASPSLGTFTSVSGSSGVNGVNFDGISPLGTHYPGGRLVVNGSTVYGLRVEGYSEFVTNLLSASRLNTLTGSGGVLTIAITNNATYTVDNGPASASLVALGLDSQGGSSPEYVLVANTLVTNFQRLVVKGGRVTLQDGFVMNKNLRLLGGTVAIPDGATVTLAQLVFSTNAAIEMGNAGGAATRLNFANSAGTIGNWFAGQVLEIKNWNGGVYGGGPDQIFVGTDATGLTASQLAQIKWINPFGSGDVMGAYQLPTGEIVPAVGQSAFSSFSGAPPATPFSATVAGAAATTYIVQVATNLTPPVSWQNLVTNVGPFAFTDYGSTNNPIRFYRVVKP